MIDPEFSLRAVKYGTGLTKCSNNFIVPSIYQNCIRLYEFTYAQPNKSEIRSKRALTLRLEGYLKYKQKKVVRFCRQRN